MILIVCDFHVLTQDEITKRLSLDKSVIAKTVTKLADTGFLLRKTNSKDKRTYDIFPTDKAQKAYPMIKKEVERCFQRMTEKMTEEERATFQRLLLLAEETTLAQED